MQAQRYHVLVSSCKHAGRLADVLGRSYDSQVCSIARALEVVGERWSVLIIRDALFARATRYNDFQRSLGIATNILKARLESRGYVRLTRQGSR